MVYTYQLSALNADVEIFLLLFDRLGAASVNGHHQRHQYEGIAAKELASASGSKIILCPSMHLLSRRHEMVGPAGYLQVMPHNADDRMWDVLDVPWSRCVDVCEKSRCAVDRPKETSQINRELGKDHGGMGLPLFQGFAVVKTVLFSTLCRTSIRGVYEMITDATRHLPIAMTGPQAG